jgi:hypothetical protein
LVAHTIGTELTGGYQLGSRIEIVAGQQGGERGLIM